MKANDFTEKQKRRAVENYIAAIINCNVLEYMASIGVRSETVHAWAKKFDMWEQVLQARKDRIAPIKTMVELGVSPLSMVRPSWPYHKRR